MLHATESRFPRTIFRKRLGFGAGFDTWGITELTTVWEFMTLSRSGKVSRSLDRQRRISKNSLYRWNNWCTCSRGRRECYFNFCPRRGEIRRADTCGKICTSWKAEIWPRPRGKREHRQLHRQSVGGQIVDIFRGMYLSMAFNGNAEHVTRLTFLWAANAFDFLHRVHERACYRVSFRAICERSAAEGRGRGSSGVNTWGLGPEYRWILGMHSVHAAGI